MDIEQQTDLELIKGIRLTDEQRVMLPKVLSLINASEIEMIHFIPLMDLIWLGHLNQKYNVTQLNNIPFVVSAGAEMAARIDKMTRDINKSMQYGGAKHSFIESMKFTLEKVL